MATFKSSLLHSLTSLYSYSPCLIALMILSLSSPESFLPPRLTSPHPSHPLCLILHLLHTLPTLIYLLFFVRPPLHSSFPSCFSILLSFLPNHLHSSTAACLTSSIMLDHTFLPPLLYLISEFLSSSLLGHSPFLSFLPDCPPFPYSSYHDCLVTLHCYPPPCLIIILYFSPQVPDDEVCGCPLVQNVFELTDNFCHLPKRLCNHHYCWEKLRRAEVDLERVRAVGYNAEWG